MQTNGGVENVPLCTALVAVTPVCCERTGTWRSVFAHWHCDFEKFCWWGKKKVRNLVRKWSPLSVLTVRQNSLWPDFSFVNERMNRAVTLMLQQITESELLLVKIPRSVKNYVNVRTGSKPVAPKLHVCPKCVFFFFPVLFIFTKIPAARLWCSL